MMQRRDVNMVLGVIIAVGLLAAASTASWLSHEKGFFAALLILGVSVSLADALGNQLRGNGFRPGSATVLFVALLLALTFIGPPHNRNYMGSLLPSVGVAGWMAVFGRQSCSRNTARRSL